MTGPLPTYDELRASHRWALPPLLNLGVEVADRQPREASAILVTDGREVTRTVSFGELSESSNRLANVLTASGVAPATGSRSSSPSARRRRSPTSRPTSSARSRCR